MYIKQFKKYIKKILLGIRYLHLLVIILVCISLFLVLIKILFCMFEEKNYNTIIKYLLMIYHLKFKAQSVTNRLLYVVDSLSGQTCFCSFIKSIVCVAISRDFIHIIKSNKLI